MKQNIIIPDRARLDAIIGKMRADGPDKLHILADFDKTLTRGAVDGEPSSSVIAQLRNNNILAHTDYANRAHALFDKYHQYEMNPDIPLATRTDQLKKWWDEHHALLIELGVNKKLLDEVVAKRTLIFRPGAPELIKLLNQRNIPVIILSASPADMIAAYLSQSKILLDNISIIANWYIFDKDGRMIGVREPVIHSLNKHEIILNEFPEFEKIKNRRNVILLGDGVNDIGMVTGFDYANLLKIGFLNENIPARMDEFQKNFDLVITDDGPMDAVLEILNKIIS